jgi:D-alanyl-D-alanine carboxypeptidase
MAVAEHIDGTVDAFVDRMNKRAKELGAVNTHFANPHGFHDDNHYTTAHDIALIMAEAVKHPEFVKYISTYEYQIGFTNIVQEVRYLHNSNKLINPYSNFYWEGCIGGKTGFTDQAGNTLVVYGGDGEHKFISAVMMEHGREYSYNDSKKLIEYAQSLYSGDKINIFSQDRAVKSINIVQDGDVVATAEISPAEDYEIELPDTMTADDVKVDIVTPESFDAPLGIGRKAGTAYALFNDRLMCSVDLTVTDIKNSDGESVEFMALADAEKAVEKTSIFNILVISACVVGALLVILIVLYIINRNIAKIKQEKRLKLKALERRERRRANLEKRIGRIDDSDE